MLIQKRYITNISIVFKFMLFKRFMIWGCCVEYCRRLFLFFFKISMCVRNIKLAYKMIQMLNECRVCVDLKKRPKIPQEKQIQNSKRNRYQILRSYKSQLINYGIIHVIRMFSLFPFLHRRQIDILWLLVSNQGFSSKIFNVPINMEINKLYNYMLQHYLFVFVFKFILLLRLLLNVCMLDIIL